MIIENKVYLYGMIDKKHYESNIETARALILAHIKEQMIAHETSSLQWSSNINIILKLTIKSMLSARRTKPKHLDNIYSFKEDNYSPHHSYRYNSNHTTPRKISRMGLEKENY